MGGRSGNRLLEESIALSEVDHQRACVDADLGSQISVSIELATQRETGMRHEDLEPTGVCIAERNPWRIRLRFRIQPYYGIYVTVPHGTANDGPPWMDLSPNGPC